MKWLNYHHLYYFWTVAREGSIARACPLLHLSQPAISNQLRALEKALGARLFDRVGRGLVLTEAGRIAFRHAEDIFALGRQLHDDLVGGAAGRTLRLTVGVADVLPRLVVHRLLAPALRLEQAVHLVCHDDKTDALLGRLAVGEIDVVLSDIPAGPQVSVRADSHLLGESGVTFLATARLGPALRPDFPASLDRAPFFLPMEGTALRHSLDQWFEAHTIRPRVRAEFGDFDLFEVFAHVDEGIFAIPTVIEGELRREYPLSVLGRIDAVRVQFYAIGVRRKRTHPAVVAIIESARTALRVDTDAP